MRKIGRAVTDRNRRLAFNGSAIFYGRLETIMAYGIQRMIIHLSIAAGFFQAGLTDATLVIHPDMQSDDHGRFVYTLWQRINFARP